MVELDLKPIPVALTRPLRQAVLRPLQYAEDLTTHEPPDAFAVGVFEGDELVSVGFVAPDGPPGSWWVRGMATVASKRGRGAGRAVLDALIGHARDQGARRVWCNGRTPARRLYERAGFRAISEEFEIPDIGPHFVMELRLGEENSRHG